ncbi:MAG: putative regulatory protein FmdB family [Chthonomonadaceae bacterium]|nr:putative regulatory protein FmdB family [Chthonomonadaceae bacterium]
MPIYEFICGECGRKFRKLVGVVAQNTEPACPRCQSTVLNRQISRFARVRSEDDTLNSLADEMETLGDSDDPKTMRRMMRDMTAAMGEDMDGDMEQMLEEGGPSPTDDNPED